MGTTLTGTTPQDTYDSLIKVTDNGPLSGTLKALSDGLGNDSALALSTGAASVTGTLAVSSGITSTGANAMLSASSSTEGLVVRGGSSIGTASTASGQILIGQTATYRGSIAYDDNAGYLYIDNLYNNNAGNIYFRTKTQGTAVEALTILGTGNVGIGTSAPTQKLHVYEASVASQAYLLVENNRARNASVYTKTTVGGFYAGTSIGTDTLCYQIYDDSAGERLRITSTGVVELAQGQIKFPATQVPSADANTLDDYEEGTFNYSITFGGGSTGIVYNHRTGTYTKIGNKVTVNGLISLSNKGSDTGDARITGLPFTIPNAVANYTAPSFQLFNITFANQVFGYAVINTNQISMNEMTEAGVVTTLTNADFANNSEVIIGLTYFV